VVILAIIKRNFGKIRALDIAIFAICIIAVIVGKVCNPIIANLTVQIAIMASFLPTIVGLLQGKLKEKAFSWFLGVLSYSFLLASVLYKPDWSWPQLAYPFLNGIVGSGSIALISCWQKPA